MKYRSVAAITLLLLVLQACGTGSSTRFCARCEEYLPPGGRCPCCGADLCEGCYADATSFYEHDTEHAYQSGYEDGYKEAYDEYYEIGPERFDEGYTAGYYDGYADREAGKNHAFK